MKERFSNNIKKTKTAVWIKSMGYVMAGLGLVVGLAWNDAIQSFVKLIFPLETNSLIAKFLYALIITLVLVIVSFKISKEE